MHSIYRKPWTSTIRTKFSLQSTSSTEDAMHFNWLYAVSMKQAQNYWTSLLCHGIFKLLFVWSYFICDVSQVPGFVIASTPLSFILSLTITSYAYACVMSLHCNWRTYRIIVIFVYLRMMGNDFVWQWMWASYCSVLVCFRFKVGRPPSIKSIA